MKSIILGWLCLAASISAQARDSILPQDFFISGKLEDSTEIKRLSNSSFELKQHWAKVDAGALNFITFCIASGIASQRKVNGWSISMESSSPNATSRVVTVVLLNNEDEAKKLPPNAKWLGYKANNDFRPTCAHFVNAKYLWPAGPLTVVKDVPTLSQDVQKGEGAFPKDNPNPTHRVTVTGMLPRSQPIDDIEILYMTETNSKEPTSACQRPNPGLPDYPIPLTSKIIVPLIRKNDSYEASFFADQYLPGSCTWHLQYISYRLNFPGFSDRTPLQNKLLAAGRNPVADAAVLARPDHGNRMDLWCLTPPRNILITCMDFGDFSSARKLTPAQIASIPFVDREQDFAYIFPDTTSVQANFHEFDAKLNQQ